MRDKLKLFFTIFVSFKFYIFKSNQLAIKEGIEEGIEVGQIFNFGLKYTQAIQASVMGANGEKIYPNN